MPGPMQCPNTILNLLGQDLSRHLQNLQLLTYCSWRLQVK